MQPWSSSPCFSSTVTGKKLSRRRANCRRLPPLAERTRKTSLRLLRTRTGSGPGSILRTAVPLLTQASDWKHPVFVQGANHLDAADHTKAKRRSDGALTRIPLRRPHPLSFSLALLLPAKVRAASMLLPEPTLLDAILHLHHVRFPWMRVVFFSSPADWPPYYCCSAPSPLISTGFAIPPSLDRTSISTYRSPSITRTPRLHLLDG